MTYYLILKNTPLARLPSWLEAFDYCLLNGDLYWFCVPFGYQNDLDGAIAKLQLMGFDVWGIEKRSSFSVTTWRLC